jgi:hypothetical protein
VAATGHLGAHSLSAARAPSLREIKFPQVSAISVDLWQLAVNRECGEFRSGKYLPRQIDLEPMHGWLTAEMENGPFRVLLERPIDLPNVDVTKQNWRLFTDSTTMCSGCGLEKLVPGKSFFGTPQPGKLGVEEGAGLGGGFARRRPRRYDRWRRWHLGAAVSLVAAVGSAATCS